MIRLKIIKDKNHRSKNIGEIIKIIWREIYKVNRGLSNVLVIAVVQPGL